MKKTSLLASVLLCLLLLTGCTRNEEYSVQEHKRIGEQLMQQYYLGACSLDDYVLSNYDWVPTTIDKVETEFVYVITDDNKTFHAVCRNALYMKGECTEKERYIRISYTLDDKIITVKEVMDYANQIY